MADWLLARKRQPGPAVAIDIIFRVDLRQISAAASK